MIQVFRFMGMPDKVLAFDELPDRFLSGFELCRADGFPKDWKNWMGKIKKITKIPPEKDLLTGGVRRYEPIVEEDSFFYLVDWNLKQNEEKWQELTNYVKQVVSKEVRLLDKIEDMARPLAEDKTSGISLNTEDVVVIPIPKEVSLVSSKGEIVPQHTIAKEEVKKEVVMKCDELGCEYEAKGTYAKNSIRFHKNKKHPKKTEVLAV